MFGTASPMSLSVVTGLIGLQGRSENATLFSDLEQ
jgi:hypothetical protein